VLCEYLKFQIESNSYSIRLSPKPIKLFEIIEYLLKHNIYKEGTVSQ